MIYKKTLTYRLFSACLAVFVSVSFLIPANAQTVLHLPSPGTMIASSIAFHPPIIDGMIIDPDSPLKFDFLIHQGDHLLDGAAFQQEAQKLINYFMATLTIPEDEMWVNLSPYENNRIIADGLSQTEMGRDMLAQDYILKQLTASLMYPEEDFGREFWNKIFKKAQEKYGSIDIPVNTYNKIWIVPQDAAVYVKDNVVFVSEQHLKVMLEEDYIALEQSSLSSTPIDSLEKDAWSDETKQLIREILVPEIEREVNQGENFANLRQIYNSMILATWFKRNLKESVLGKVYVDQNKIAGIDNVELNAKEKIYARYIEAFKKGVYNYIKADYDTVTHEVIPRKYFSGGLEGLQRISIKNEKSSAAVSFSGIQAPHKKVSVDVAMLVSGADLSEKQHEIVNQAIQEYFTDPEKRSCGDWLIG